MLTPSLWKQWVVVVLNISSHELRVHIINAKSWMRSSGSTWSRLFNSLLRAQQQRRAPSPKLISARMSWMMVFTSSGNLLPTPFLAKLMLHKGVGSVALPVKTVRKVGAMKDVSKSAFFKTVPFLAALTCFLATKNFLTKSPLIGCSVKLRVSPLTSSFNTKAKSSPFSTKVQSPGARDATRLNWERKSHAYAIATISNCDSEGCDDYSELWITIDLVDSARLANPSPTSGLSCVSWVCGSAMPFVFSLLPLPADSPHLEPQKSWIRNQSSTHPLLHLFKQISKLSFSF